MKNLPDQGEYKVVIVDEPDTQEFPDCLREEWLLDGLTHRGGDHPAVIIRSKETGAIVSEIWCKHGEVHRGNDKPAMVTDDGIDIVMAWYQDGKEHREFGPAAFLQNKFTNIIHEEHWYKNGLHHRLDGPALMYRDSDTGIIHEEEWYLHGKLSRFDGPAKIGRDDHTGEVGFRVYYENGIKGKSEYGLIGSPEL